MDKELNQLYLMAILLIENEPHEGDFTSTAHRLFWAFQKEDDVGDLEYLAFLHQCVTCDLSLPVPDSTVFTYMHRASVSAEEMEELFAEFWGPLARHHVKDNVDEWRAFRQLMTEEGFEC